MIEWKPIKGFEGLYEVSNLGQVRSFYSGEAKILKPYVVKNGYLQVHLFKNGTRCNKTIHRLVAKAFIPNPENKPQVNHIDGDKTNNKVDNLEWVTGKENMQHAYNAGLHKPIKLTEEHKRKLSEALKGENHPKSKRVICVTTGEIFNCVREAQEKYNVANQNISKCCKNKLKSAGKHPVTGEKLVWEYIKGE